MKLILLAVVKKVVNIQFRIYNDSEDTELTHEDATIPVHEEAALLLRNRRAPSRLGALTGDWLLKTLLKMHLILSQMLMSQKQFMKH